MNEKIEYVVNGNHVLSFPLSADIVPVNLDFSAEDLNFQFSLDNWDEAVEKLLILDNPHKFPVSFTVESTNPTFQISSGGGGVIRSQSSVEVVVRWAPDMLGPPKQEGHLIIKMVGGERALASEGWCVGLVAGPLHALHGQASPVTTGCPSSAFSSFALTTHHPSASSITPTHSIARAPRRGAQAHLHEW